MTKDQQTQTGEKRQGIFMDKDLLKELITTIVQRFRNRSLSSHEYPYLIIDARYEHIRHLGHIVSKAFLVIAGINEDGYREVLDFGVADSENEQSWGDLFRSLKQRGLHGTEIIVSDAHLGIQCAVRKHFQGVAWQRCRVHFARELVARVSFRNRKELTGDLKEIFATESKEESMALAEETASKWQNRFPKVSKILMSGIEDCLTYKSLPRIYQHRLSSTNMLERIMRECKRRSRVINIFPSDQSCIRYLGTLLIELHEEWIAEPKTSTYLPAKKTRYITMN